MVSKPNILVICSDQHHPGIAGYRGDPRIQTPNLDRLASQGAHFTRAYCTSPICTPSRMSFITGKYVHQIDNWAIGVPLDPNEMTWARRLDQAGIPSTMFGKMDFCGGYQDGGFTEHKILQRRKAWTDIPRKSPWAPRLKGYSRKDKRRHLLQAGLMGKNGGETVGGQTVASPSFYEHDRQVTGWALEYLRGKGEEKSGPWALYVGLLYPHWPYNCPKEYLLKYYPDNIGMPHDARFPNPDLHPTMKNLESSHELGEVTEEMVLRARSAYYGMVTCMDDMIGEILGELDRQGMADNTFIIYTSDHGDSLGEHGLFYKECPYEGSVGVPLIVKGPGIPAETRIDHPVDLVDMYPTVLDMAGLESEPDRPGKSWLPLVKGEKQDRPDYAFAEYHASFLRNAWYMIVRDNFKYIYYTDDRPSLFDIQNDPEENHDLALDPKYRGILDEFETLLRSILDPEETAFRAKHDLGLIGEDGTDYTQTLTVDELMAGKEAGVFPEDTPRA